MSLTNFKEYTTENYISDIEHFGLSEVWYKILNSIKDKNAKYGVVSLDNIGQLYELGLAYVNKTNKKELGKYYTPMDTATLMADIFRDLKGENVCDVCCGTGNLILSYLEQIGRNNAVSLISAGQVYLYDQDDLALHICKSIIGIIYGKELEDKLNCVVGDFLDKNVCLPENCKVISNPPYASIKETKENWNQTDVLSESKELYSVIMEKIMENSVASVIITPFSFLGGDKFYSLRKIMNNYNGYIVSFDNVPGSIFSGKKHGVFNTNTTNSVRAAITIVENKPNEKGFRCSGLIRFKNEEKPELLKKDTLLKLVGNTYQTVSESKKNYYKCFTDMESIYNIWSKQDILLKDLLSKEKEYTLCFPNTGRYFTVASIRDLDRTGKLVLSFKNEETQKLLYTYLNSSFCYWYWRMFDGGITYSLSLLKSLPVIDFDKMDKHDKERLIELATEMQKNESKYLTYKKNAGKMQENIKFPDVYRNEINQIILRSLKIEADASVFDVVHANSIFQK